MENEGTIHPIGIIGEGELDQLVATALNARFRAFMVRLINDLGLDFESVISRADHILAKPESLGPFLGLPTDRESMGNRKLEAVKSVIEQWVKWCQWRFDDEPNGTYKKTYLRGKIDTYETVLKLLNMNEHDIIELII